MKHHPGSLAVDRPVSDSEAVHFGVSSASPESLGASTSPAAEAAPRQEPAPQATHPAVEAVRVNPAAPARGRLRQILIGGAGVAALALGAYYGWNYWTVGRFQGSTDDAFFLGVLIAIAPKVSGYLNV